MSEISMHILVGLGNPGIRYEQTRHNAGFMFVESVRQQLQLPAWVMMKKANALVTKNSSWMLIEPQQFMNLSGLAVRSILDYYFKFGELSPIEKKAMLQSIYVAHDDLDLVLGSTKLQLGRGPKVHNGLKSLYEHLGSVDFWHMRLGVDGRSVAERRAGREYVLEDFLPDQRPIFDEAIQAATKKVFENAKV